MTPRRFVTSILTIAEIEVRKIRHDSSELWTRVIQPALWLLVFGEVFNVLNIANLSGYSGNLQQPAAFGQPTSRATQIFGSGGPRAFQFGVRLAF